MRLTTTSKSVRAIPKRCAKAQAKATCSRCCRMLAVGVLAVACQLLAALRSHQRQELVAGLLVVPERAEHRARHGLPVLLFHAAHLHAQVPRLDDHPNPLRRQPLLPRLRDLAGPAFMNLE